MPTPTPTGGIAAYPELQHIGDSLVAALQALGIGLVAICVCVIGLVALTSLGSEHRHSLFRVAAVSLIAGFVVLMNAQTIAGILQRMFP